MQNICYIWQNATITVFFFKLLTTVAASFYCKRSTLIDFFKWCKFIQDAHFCCGVWHILISLNSVCTPLWTHFLFCHKLWSRPTFWGLSWWKLVFGWKKTLKKMSELLSNSVFWAKSSMVRWKTLCRHLKRGQGHCKLTPEFRMLQLQMPPLL